MNPLVLEWLRKAEADLRTAEREAGVICGPNFDAVCFHSQQCAEKALKALAISQGLRPPKVHDLQILAAGLTHFFPVLADLREIFSELTIYALEFRYPGEEATSEMAISAVRGARQILEQIRKLLSS